MSQPYAAYIGRFQTWHEGHDWLIYQKLKEGISVLLLVRNVEADEHNPKSGAEVFFDLCRKFSKVVDVKVMLIPDIESINYGRDVGYEVNEWEPPEEIKAISGTKLRERHD